MGKVMAGKPEDHEDVFVSFAKYVAKQLDDITSEMNGSNDESKCRPVVKDFNRDHHWQKLGLCFQTVSKECTKLAVAYSKPPEPDREEKKALTESVTKALDVLWAWYEAFPLSEGQAVCVELRRTVCCTLEAVQDFVSSIKGEKCSESSTRLQATGVVWKCCESFENLPKDNVSATIARLTKDYQLLNDAFNEFEEELANLEEHLSQDETGDANGHGGDDDDCPKWTKNDTLLFQPCLGLIKTGKGTLKRIKNNIKTKGLTTSSNSIEELDKTVEVADRLSPCIDDLVLSLYPFVNHSAVINNANLVAQHLKTCVDTARYCHYTDETDHSWLDFLSNAVSHNLKKLSDLPGT
eukprot:Seg2552.3 transcript_id=Seg2552.3/GoldUCD/mRNA.D3Y31 product="Cyclin-D1-binding protein 1-like" protein_id=Seg2552.3/GoldUCD/D3Y31